MAKRATRELRELSRHDLELRLQESQNDLLTMRFNLATRKAENTTRVRQVKREIARIKTLLTEMDREA